MSRLRARNARLVIQLEGIDDQGRVKDLVTEGGIHLAGITRDSVTGMAYQVLTQNRWAKVISAGPDCTELHDGDRVMLFAQKWTERFEFEGVGYWFADEEHVLLLDQLHRDSDGKEKVKQEMVWGEGVTGTRENPHAEQTAPNISEF